MTTLISHTTNRRWIIAISSLAIAMACSGDRASLGPNVSPTPLLSIVPGGGDNQTGAAGTTLPLPLVVKLVGVTGVLNNRVLNFVVTSGGGSVFAVAVETGTPSSGPAAGQSGVGQNTWTLGPTVGPQTVEARLVDPKTGQTLTQATFRATASAGSAAILKTVTGDGQLAVAGTSVSVPPSVLVTDRLGNPLPNVPVLFQVVGGSGSINGSNPILTGANGIATLGGWRVGATAGQNSLTASSASIVGSALTFTATGTPGAATSIAATAGDLQRVAASTGLPVAPSIQARDANGNGVAGIAVTFTVMTGGGSMDGIASVTTLTNPTGIATVGWSVGPSEGANTLRATALGLTGSPTTFQATAYAPYYVANQNAQSITVYEPESSGNAAPVRTISGSNTGLGVSTSSLPASMYRDPLGQLYVTSFAGGAVLIFEAGATGNVSPIRTISGPSTGLSRAFAITRDAAGQIYVFDYDSQAIRVFASDANGNAFPVRSIVGANTGLIGVPALSVSATGELFAADQDAGNIKVFAPGASGDVAPIRVISGPSTGLASPGALVLTGTGQLYIANFRGASVTVYDAGATGDVAPIRTIAGSNTGLDFPTGLGLDRSGRVFVSNYILQTITVFAPGANGNVAPVRTVGGPATGLNRPGWLTF